MLIKFDIAVGVDTNKSRGFSNTQISRILTFYWKRVET